MKKLLTLTAFIVSSFLFTAPTAMAGEGWCGGTDTTSCCKKLNNKKCSCVCIPGNCHCGPVLKAAPGMNTLPSNTPITTIQIQPSQLGRISRPTGPQSPATGFSSRPGSKRPGGSSAGDISNGQCCATVGNVCISECQQAGGCTGVGDCKLASP